ncbi:MAG TPA: hypothetical protein PLB91_15965 [Spirochaetales bacterium]|nr:hypothetical protein [Spirochaetales bacterium]HRY55207.1 hypothetical protein [Spirochaetia bacterium]HRZ66416.1 hypothetical protein [Spirochaetia bacterium]
MKILHRATLAALAAAALLASSCNNSYGVFYSIQQETEQSGSEYFKKATTTGVYKLGSGASTAYFASGTKLYTRGLADSDWSVESIGGTRDYRLLAATGNGTYLLASIYASGACKLLQREAATAWTEIDISAIPAGSWIDGLYFAGGAFFAQAHDNYENEDDETDDTYSLFYLSGTSLLACDANLQGLNYERSFSGVAYDTSTLTFWYATRKGLFSSGNPDTLATALASGTGPGGLTATSIAYFDSALFVGVYDYDEDDPYLYRLSGGSWVNVTDSDFEGPPTALCYITAPAKMLVGEALVSSSTGGGYYEGSSYSSLKSGEQDDKSYVARSESIYSTTIGSRAVNAFFWDDDNDTLFISMSPGASSASYYGLYSTVYDGSTWSGWEAE